MEQYYGDVGGANDPLRDGDPMTPLNMLKKYALPLILLSWFGGMVWWYGHFVLDIDVAVSSKLFVHRHRNTFPICLMLSGL